MANDHEELVALFRYSVISEAVASTCHPQSAVLSCVRSPRVPGRAQRARSTATRAARSIDGSPPINVTAGGTFAGETGDKGRAG